MVRFDIRRWPAGAVFLTALVMLLISHRGSADAARGAGSETRLPPAYELIVFEAPGCIYCKLFRRDVAPAYSTSARSREAPLRFANASEAVRLVPGLKRGLTTVPTAVLVKDGKEVARIEGYTGPEPFFQIMARLFAKLTR
ncbi:MAG: thioredoxin family protein [Pseudomonadota bacterium]